MKALVLETSVLRWAACKAASGLWRGVYASPLALLRLKEVPPPALPGPGWVRLQTCLGGICGTDLSLIFQQTHPATIVRPFTTLPAVLGHENVATIAELGPGVEGWSVGERVVVEPSLGCAVRGIHPPCASCRTGRFCLCENFRRGSVPTGTMIGLNQFTSGSWSPGFVAHVSQLHRVPDDIPDEQAVLIDPVACSLHAVLRRLPADGERVFVQGAGIVGVGVVLAMRALGCRNRLVCAARHATQAERLKAAGADEVVIIPRKATREEQYTRLAPALEAERVGGAFGNQVLIGGADVVYDCVGTGRSLSDALKCCRAGGTVVAVGTSQITLVDTTALWFKELNVLGAYGRSMESWKGEALHAYDVVIDLVREGRLSLDGMLTHTYPLEEYRTALRDHLERGRSGLFKAAFRPV